jgi:2-polyprenyl-3-methyl-5-hydroxy-6-metoxy-1,4-benzoquinol methylase
MKLLYSHGEAIDTILKKISFKYKNLRSFLDLGCGDGNRTIIFNEHGRVIAGLDYNDYRSLGNKDFNFLKEDIFNNSLKPASFDIVLNFDVVEHLVNPDKLLREIHRILKKDGICILSTPNKYRIFGALLILLGLRKFPYCLNQKDENSKNNPDFWHQREYTARELRRLVEKNNFQIVKVFKVFYGITGSFGLLKLFNAPFCHNFIFVLKKR